MWFNDSVYQLTFRSDLLSLGLSNKTSFLTEKKINADQDRIDKFNSA